MKLEEYYDQALAAAQAAYAGTKVADSTVCAVAIKADGSAKVSLFSGKDGFKQLKTLRQSSRPVKGDIGAAITTELTNFLQTPGGGGFSTEQINKKGFDDHGRGAMNCAEPKVYNHIKMALENDPKEWVLLSFTRENGVVKYWAPCRNCRRFAYQQFNNLSWLIAAKYGGVAALEGAKSAGRDALTNSAEF
ncbi:conserved hypothetical protein [Erythrobacter sp. EC-HK427]|nr:conserved hypothetical protein [Erythrobacter sp. EC-HK427]